MLDNPFRALGRAKEQEHGGIPWVNPFVICASQKPIALVQISDSTALDPECIAWLNVLSMSAIWVIRKKGIEMKLYHGKGSCSLGIQVLLEEAGEEYEIIGLNLAGGEQKSAEYLALNPKAKVPMLEIEASTFITEWPAIAAYLSASHPKLGLMPSDPLRLARTLETVDYLVSTVHMQGFSRIVRPGNFSPSEADHAAVVARGREILEGGLKSMDQALDGRDFVGGDFTVADAALFYIEDWKARRLGEALPAGCQAHYERMLGRESVKRAMARGN